MSRCPGLHCDGCGRGGGVLAALAATVAAGAVVAEFLVDLLIAAGTVVGLALTVAVVVLTRMKRQGQLSLHPDGLWQPGAVRPVSSPAPVTGRPARALPAPQELHVHIYGTPTREQLAGLAAIQQARPSAWREGEDHD